MVEIKEIWEKRWNWFHRPIHVVAHILHPLWRKEAQRFDRELNTGWATYLDKIQTDIVVQDKLEDQLLLFRNQNGDFGFPRAALRDAQLKPVTWWVQFQASTLLCTFRLV